MEDNKGNHMHHKKNGEFDPEMAFVRKVIEPGNQVVDLGAGFGMFTWCAAAEVGASGNVWAFETEKTAAAYLCRAIALSHLTQVQLVPSGLLERKRIDLINIKPDTGFNGDERTEEEDNFENMDLSCLDDAMRDFSWTEIDFMRIGADVRMENILKGGVSFLSCHSPLIMLEIKHGQCFHSELMHAFKSLGYDSYYLIPGIGCLAPFCKENSVAPLYLNVFLCKLDCAARLEAKNLLIYRKIDMTSGVKTAPNLWIDYVQKYPYAIRLLQLWDHFIQNNESNLHWRLHQEALSSYAVSRMIQMPAPDRFQALKWAYRLLEDMARENPTFPRLMSLVRVASDLGYREQADIVLSRLIEMMETGDNVSVDEPFLAISSHFELIDPAHEVGNWCLVSLLETYEQNRPFPVPTDAHVSLGNLELLKTLPFYNPEMEQRRKSIRERIGL
jgi:FkbM family methyltransferase